MLSVKSAITNTIPISNFNRGVAGKIFADVRTSGAKVVIKNNMPECVLLSPEEYVKMVNVCLLKKFNYAGIAPYLLWS